MHVSNVMLLMCIAILIVNVLNTVTVTVKHNDSDVTL